MCGANRKGSDELHVLEDFRTIPLGLPNMKTRAIPKAATI